MSVSTNFFFKLENLQQLMSNFCSRQCRTFAVDSDELSWWELVDLAKKCGGYTNIESIHYHKPSQGLESGLRNVKNDTEVREMVEVALKYSLESPLIWADLVDEGYDSSDSDSIYDPLADEGQGNDSELDDYMIITLDISDDEYITARERVIGCNKQLSDLTQQMQKEAAELGGVGSVGEGGVRGVVTDTGVLVIEEKALRRGTFVVKSVVNDYTCLRLLERNRQLKSSWVAEQFLEVFKDKPHWPAKDIIQTLKLAYKVFVKKDFAYKVKYYVHKMLHGSMKYHYQKDGRYMEALKQASPGSCLEVVTDPTQVVAPPLFQRMFVSFEGL
ncbi:30S ribosomal protein S2 [Bienertia sinuspersici]